MTSIRIKVLLDDAHLEQTSAVSDALSGIGMAVEDCVPEAGVVFGSVDESRLEAVRAVDGVVSVDCEDSYQLPPMSGKVPQ